MGLHIIAITFIILILLSIGKGMRYRYSEEIAILNYKEALRWEKKLDVIIFLKRIVLLLFWIPFYTSSADILFLLFSFYFLIIYVMFDGIANLFRFLPRHTFLQRFFYVEKPLVNINSKVSKLNILYHKVKPYLHVLSIIMFITALMLHMRHQM